MHHDPTRSRRRPQPEATALHAVVRDNLRTLYAAIEHGFAAPLPAFVRDELEAFVDCGVLARGFGLLRCENPDCRERELVAFSCKGRGFCPSCLGRRMAETAANLVAPKGFLSDIERGLALPSVHALSVIAEHLGVDVLDLVTFPDASERQALVDRTRKLSRGVVRKLLREMAPDPRSSVSKSRPLRGGATRLA